MSLASTPPDPKLDLVFERVVDVSPRLVWAAWTRPEYLTQWFTPAPWKTVEAEVDLRPGGIFRTVFLPPEGEQITNVNTYLEVVPEKRLVWTSAVDPGFRPAASKSLHGFHFTVILSLEPEGRGTRYLATVLHSDKESRAAHESMGFQEGWSAALAQLIALARTMSD